MSPALSVCLALWLGLVLGLYLVALWRVLTYGKGQQRPRKQTDDPSRV